MGYSCSPIKASKHVKIWKDLLRLSGKTCHDYPKCAADLQQRKDHSYDCQEVEVRRQTCYSSPVCKCLLVEFVLGIWGDTDNLR